MHKMSWQPAVGGAYESGYPRQGNLVETDWLDANLDNPALRIIDCSADFYAEPGTGKTRWLDGHIPGSAYADLLEALSDPDSDLPLMLPKPRQFADVMGELGVGRGTTAVVYDNANGMCAARLWWMLRAYGFNDAVILNGGLPKWLMEQRKITRALPVRRKTQFPLLAAPKVFVDKETVLKNMRTKRAQLIDALSPEAFDGSLQRYGRPGHIPGSINVPAKALVDPKTMTFLPAKALNALFLQAGLKVLGPTISYCGGGLAACSVAFALFLLGADDITVYDASLFEWAADPALPLETGNQSG
ncbi:sulfurtransferase [Desulfovibrio desulfuricans]|uniref:Sulfurtransferase n=2 Tax=Desulfovibrio desulfuricans TaxID=876 RepID=A0A4P7UIT7_DESDE|nr:sulfurtransferase [Desulfovibrio desulfuricans]